MENIIIFIDTYGRYFPAVLVLVFITMLILGIRNAVRLNALKSINVQNNPLDGVRFDDNPEKLKKKIKVQMLTAIISMFLLSSCVTFKSFYKMMKDAGYLVTSEDINHPQDENGATPLMIAIKRGLPAATLKKIIDKGADVNATDRIGDTPLMYAASWARPEQIQLLLDSGARADDKNNSGDTALFRAVKWRKPENVFFLADKGMDLNATGYADYTPLVAALHDWHSVQRGKAETDLSKLRAKNRANHERYTARTEESIRIIIQYLLSRNVNVYTKDCRGMDAVGLSEGTEFERDIKKLAAVQQEPSQNNVQQGN